MIKKDTSSPQGNQGKVVTPKVTKPMFNPAKKTAKKPFPC